MTNTIAKLIEEENADGVRKIIRAEALPTVLVQTLLYGNKTWMSQEKYASKILNAGS